MDKRLVLFFLFYWFTIDVAFPHSGRTDKNGGHHDRIHGGYHYHHGMPAHDHPNGICPYANVTRNTSNTHKSEDERKGASWTVRIILLLLVAPIVIIPLIVVYNALVEIYRNRKNKAELLESLKWLGNLILIGLGILFVFYWMCH